MLSDYVRIFDFKNCFPYPLIRRIHILGACLGEEEKKTGRRNRSKRERTVSSRVVATQKARN